MIICTSIYFINKRRTITKADKTTKAQVKCGPRKNVVSNVDCIQNNSYFVLKQCPQYISKGSDSSNENPYNNSDTYQTQMIFPCRTRQYILIGHVLMHLSIFISIQCIQFVVMLFHTNTIAIYNKVCVNKLIYVHYRFLFYKTVWRPGTYNFFMVLSITHIMFSFQVKNCNTWINRTNYIFIYYQ